MNEERKRAPNGSAETGFLLRLPEELRKAAKRAARAEGINESEWWRRAGQDKLVRGGKMVRR